MEKYLHHQQGIKALIEEFKDDPSIKALLLTGSIAHGLASESSDIDYCVVIEESDYQLRKTKRQLTDWKDFSHLYPGLYGDGKFVSVKFMEQVAEQGSEPARFAFADA